MRSRAIGKSFVTTGESCEKTGGNCSEIARSCNATGANTMMIIAISPVVSVPAGLIGYDRRFST
jgi:hypothetical protein